MKTVKAVFSLLFLFLMLASDAQSVYFRQRLEYFENDVAINNGVLIDGDNYLLFGSNKTPFVNEYAATLVKLDSLGNRIDSSSVYFPGHILGYVSLFRFTYGYLGVGYHQMPGGGNRFDPYLIRLNDDLDTIWTKKIFIGSDTLPFVSNAILCSDSTIAITGMVNDTLNLDQNIMFLRVDTLGNILTFKSLGWPNSIDYCETNMDQTMDGGFVIGAGTEFYHPLGSGYYKQIAIKLDSSGDLQWVHQIGRNDAQNGSLLVKSLSDSSIVLYSAIPIASGLSGPYKWYIKKVNYQNQQIWYQEYPEVENYPGVGRLLELSDHSLVMTRTKYSEAKPLLVKFDSLGNYIWQRYLPWGLGNHVGTYLQNVPLDNGFAISGFYQPNYVLGESGSQDLYLIKTNCLGFAEPPLASLALQNPGNFQVQLENNSSAFGQCYVNWGDGETDTLYESSDTLQWHTYPGAGTYAITLVATACGDADTVQQTYSATATGIAEYGNQVVRVWPNPVQHSLSIRFHESGYFRKISISDLTGREVMAKELLMDETDVYLDVSALANGFYLISFYNTVSEPVVFKVLKE